MLVSKMSLTFVLMTAISTSSYAASAEQSVSDHPIGPARSATTGVDSRDGTGGTKLMAAAWTGNTDEAKALIAAGADVNAQEIQGQSPLLLAAFKGNLEIVNILIAAGARVNITNKDGDTALTLAARSGHEDCVRALLMARADLDAQEDTFGQAALTLAAKNGYANVVKALISAGADVKAQDNGAKTAVDYAQKYPDIVAALKGAEAQFAGKLHTRLDGTAIDAAITQQGLGKKSHIDISNSDITQEYTSIGGAKLTFSARHQWEAPVTLRAFDSGGKAAYSVGAMVAQQGQSGNVLAALLPVAPGTIYRVFGRVQLFGNTITADGNSPLLLVVHSVRGADAGKTDFLTNGPLSPTIFYFSNAPARVNPAAKDDILFQLVPIGGKGSAKLKDGTSVAFN